MSINIAPSIEPQNNVPVKMGDHVKLLLNSLPGKSAYFIGCIDGDIDPVDYYRTHQKQIDEFAINHSHGGNYGIEGVSLNILQPGIRNNQLLYVMLNYECAEYITTFIHDDPDLSTATVFGTLLFLPEQCFNTGHW